ncbi:MAG: DUF4248 domain-containing protein [Prevotella sp.]|nr:DUF4248 domain-containing protein [Prevotella sp.]
MHVFLLFRKIIVTFATVEHRAQGRTELAMKYLPHLQPSSAWSCLRRWINHNRELREELQKLGYDGRQRVFTPRQVEAIMRYLGEP